MNKLVFVSQKKKKIPPPKKTKIRVGGYFRARCSFEKVFLKKRRKQKPKVFCTAPQILAHIFPVNCPTIIRTRKSLFCYY